VTRTRRLRSPPRDRLGERTAQNAACFSRNRGDVACAVGRAGKSLAQPCPEHSRRTCGPSGLRHLYRPIPRSVRRPAALRSPSWVHARPIAWPSIARGVVPGLASSTRGPSVGGPADHSRPSAPSAHVVPAASLAAHLMRRCLLRMTRPADSLCPSRLEQTKPCVRGVSSSTSGGRP
jgi:hypothetical protein